MSLQFLISPPLMVVIIIAIVIFSPFRNNSFSVKDCPPDCGTIAGPLLLPGFHLEGPKCRMLDLQIPIPDILLWYQSSEPQNTFLQRPTCCEKTSLHVKIHIGECQVFWLKYDDDVMGAQARNHSVAIVNVTD